MGSIIELRHGMMGVPMLYSLTQPLICNGTSGQEIDTGIAPFQTCSQFTVLAEASPSAFVKEGTVLHCKIETSPWLGFSFDRQGSNANQRTSAFGVNSTVNVSDNDLIRFGVAIDVSNRYVWSYIKNLTKNTISMNNYAVGSNFAALSTNTRNILIGCYQDNSGTRGRYFKGVINSVYLFDKLFTSQGIERFLATGKVI